MSGQSVSAYFEPQPELDVYVTSRTLCKNAGKLFNRLPIGVKQLATDAGFAHFMLVVRDPTEGTLHQFDFGPHGADTHLSMPGRKASSGVPGEVREAQLAALPEHHLFVGRTAVSLQDIRAFNNSQHLPYLLNVNDCRHYINRTVTFATGVQNPKASFAVFGTLAGRKMWAGAAKARPQSMARTASTAALASRSAAIARPSLPQLAMHRAASAMVTAAQAPAARPYRVRPLFQHVARLGARAGSSLRAAAASAASTASLFRRQGSSSASGMAATATGRFRQAGSRGATRAPPVGV